MFSKLMERKPGLKQELLTFRDHLLAAASQEQVLKVGLEFTCPYPGFP